MMLSHRWVLVARPHGLPGLEDLRLETMKIDRPEAGEIVLRNLFISYQPA